MVKIVDKQLLDDVIEQARKSPRLRMNYNFHQDLNDKCQRLLNAMEPGTVMPIHHHKVDEMWIVVKGRLRLTIHNDEGNVIDSYELSPYNGDFGVNIPANTWHSVNVLFSASGNQYKCLPFLRLTSFI